MSCKRTALLNLLLFPGKRLQQNPWFFFFQLWKYNNLFYSDHTRRQMVLYLLRYQLLLHKEISETEGASFFNIAEICHSSIWPLSLYLTEFLKPALKTLYFVLKGVCSIWSPNLVSDLQVTMNTFFIEINVVLQSD